MVVKYIIGHWTAGNHKPCQLDLDSYQLLIDGEGERHKGRQVGKTASTGGMNSITYNISCCGGLFTSRITKAQQEAFFKACAEKIKEYGLTVNDFYTHAEIGWMCKENTIQKLVPYNQWLYQNIGKRDLTELPTIKGNPEKTGNYIRHKIKWYLQRVP
jgi:hypothetical protein